MTVVVMAIVVSVEGSVLPEISFTVLTELLVGTGRTTVGQPTCSAGRKGVALARTSTSHT